MRIHVNGAQRDVADDTTVDDVVRTVVTGDARGTAVALDGEVVPRLQWPATRVPPDARLEVVRAVQGGSR